jgi:hypothetical protein
MEKLAKELETYQENRDSLLSTAEGMFVLIKGDDVLGEFDTEADAIRQGYLQLGNVPFLVKQVLQVERKFTLPSSLIEL